MATTPITGQAVDQAWAQDLMRGIINPVFGGAETAGGTDASAVFKLCEQKVRDSLMDYTGLSVVNPASKPIELPPGKFTLTQVKAMLGSMPPAYMMSGFTVWSRGGTIIEHKAGASTTMMENTFWQRVRFHNIRFACHSGSAGSTFYHGINVSGSASQDVLFVDCEWSGPWKYVFHLEGDDNMSEFTWFNASASGLQDGGAFLYIPTGTSDQLLNYTFAGLTKLWSTSAALIDAGAGGHFVIQKLDASAWGSAAGSMLFKLRGNSHADGVMQFQCEALRVELFSSTAGILYNEWGRGNVTFRHVDVTSQVPVRAIGTLFDLRLASTRGAILHVTDSDLAGKVAVTTGAAAPNVFPIILFERCEWRDAIRPSDVVVYTNDGGMDRLGPHVEFRDCRTGNGAYDSPLGTSGWAVWDAVVGARGRMGAPLSKRELHLTNAWNGPSTGDVLKVLLPVGALVTGFRAISPTGWGQGTGTFTLKDAAGTTLGTAAVTAAASGGYKVGGDLAVPVLCDTSTKATITVTNTLQLNNLDGRVIVEGYW